MKHSRGLQPVASIAKAHERNAARLMGEMLSQAEAQQLQMETLMNYRKDYIENFSTASREGLSAIQMQDYQVFINRLDTAIEQQKEQVKQSRQECEQSRDYWRSKYNHSEMIRKVLESRQQQERQIKNSKEQKEADDRSAVAYVGNKCN